MGRHRASDDVELRRRWARKLLEAWRRYNWLYLREALRPPVIEIGGATGKLGEWFRDTRTIRIAGSHVERDPWNGVMETLRHEMAHQYAHEVLRASDEVPHGDAFRRACELLRVSASASGDGKPQVSDQAEERVLERVRKLLALGNSPNQNESEVALRKARELLVRHNLATQDLRERRFEWRELGQVRQRHHRHEQLLAGLLTEFFFVEAIWIDTYVAGQDRDARVLEIHGTRANCDMAEYVHEHIHAVLPQLWTTHREAAEVPGNRDRLRYFAGVVSGFAETLREQDEGLRGKALVVAGDPQLQAHFRWLHPRVRGVWLRGGDANAAYEAGVEAGRDLKLRRPVESGDGVTGFLTGG